MRMKMNVNRKTKSIGVLIFVLLVTAIVGCSTTGSHGGNVESHESNTAAHGAEPSSHGNESSTHGSEASSHESNDGSHGSDHSEQAAASTGEGQFPTVGFEEQVEVTIPFPIAEVCPLFEPAGRFLTYDWWNPTILREAEGETLEGLIMGARGFDLDILLFVTQHNPAEGQIQYNVLWGDFELQRIDITCVEGDTPGSTNVIWNERNAGIHENGVSLVTAFVEGGNIRATVERYAENATQYLEDN